MPGNPRVGGLIWTNHALERLGQRGLSQNMALETFRFPEKKSAGNKTGTLMFQKLYGRSTVTVIAKKNEKEEWMILSCWIDPPLYGTADWKKKKYYHEYTRAKSVWGKLWAIIKHQIGL